MRAIVHKLKRKLKPGDTTERCGLVLTGDHIRSVPNRHPEPVKGFSIAAKDMRRAGSDLIGTWHTHPGQPSQLSQDDYLGFSQWPDLIHYVIGTDGVSAYVVAPNGIIMGVDLASH